MNKEVPWNVEQDFSYLFHGTIFNILLYILSLSPIINIYQPGKIKPGQCEFRKDRGITLNYFHLPRKELYFRSVSRYSDSSLDETV
jgi:hypothetical protein